MDQVIYLDAWKLMSLSTVPVVACLRNDYVRNNDFVHALPELTMLSGNTTQVNKISAKGHTVNIPEQIQILC